MYVIITAPKRKPTDTTCHVSVLYIHDAFVYYNHKYRKMINTIRTQAEGIV